MKVILLEDVKSLGKKGQLVEVNAGYARNFILPKKLGVEATSKNINDLKLQKAHEDKVAAEQLAAAKVLAEELKDKRQPSIKHPDRFPIHIYHHSAEIKGTYAVGKSIFPDNGIAAINTKIIRNEIV